MIAANYSTLRSRLKEFCDRVCDEKEVLIITRKEDRNVVMMSLEQYNRIEKYLRNMRYLSMLRESDEQLQSGRVIVKTMEELEELARDE
ncbi:MAG: type II toxin-antitoxin system Phd/YefM family antitoxin [Firmicutes bacterium]|nr:type II toxin-antitoxin system Phd/YefM family antitoxin [Bacillota bacterium]